MTSKIQPPLRPLLAPGAAVLGLTLASTLLLAGCASGNGPQLLANRGAYDAVLGQVAQAGGADVLVSGCTYRDEVGSDALLLETSAAMAGVVSRDIVDYLTAQGAPPPPLPPAVVMPVCAGFALPANETVMIKTNADDAEPRPVLPAQLYPPGQPADAPGVREALDRLFLLAFNTDPFKPAVRAAPTLDPAVLPLTPAERDTLRTATGRNWVWVALAVQEEKSFTKGFAQGMANEMSKKYKTALVGGAMGMTMISGVPTLTQAALVDLTTGTRVWRGQVGGVAPGVDMSTGLMMTGTVRRHTSVGEWGDVLFAPVLHTGVKPPVVGMAPTPVPPVSQPSGTAPMPTPAVPTPSSAPAAPASVSAPVPSAVTTATAIPSGPPATTPPPPAGPAPATALATVVEPRGLVPSTRQVTPPALATINIKGRLPVHTLPHEDAPFIVLEPGTPLSILGMPTSVPNSNIHWVHVGTDKMQGWATVTAVRAQY